MGQNFQTPKDETSVNLSILVTHSRRQFFPEIIFWFPSNCFQNLHIFWYRLLEMKVSYFLILRKSVPYSYSVLFLFSLAAKGRSIHSRVLQFSVNRQKFSSPAHKTGRRINGKILAFAVLLYLICYALKHSRDSYL